MKLVPFFVPVNSAIILPKKLIEMEKVRVLFICMGNICRSPTAQGVFERLVEQTGLTQYIQIDSAGTHAYHVGNAPDPRAQAAAQRRGIDLSAQRARRVEPVDFELYDYILVMDRDNLEHLDALCPSDYRHKLRRLLEFVPELQDKDVPDPYYGGPSGFERVLDLVEMGTEGLLRHIRQRHLNSAFK